MKKNQSANILKFFYLRFSIKRLFTNAFTSKLTEEHPLKKLLYFTNFTTDRLMLGECFSTRRNNNKKKKNLYTKVLVKIEWNKANACAFSLSPGFEGKRNNQKII